MQKKSAKKEEKILAIYERNKHNGDKDYFLMDCF
jgi:hypothetical protein